MAQKDEYLAHLDGVIADYDMDVARLNSLLRDVDRGFTHTKTRSELMYDRERVTLFQYTLEDIRTKYLNVKVFGGDFNKWLLTEISEKSEMLSRNDGEKLEAAKLYALAHAAQSYNEYKKTPTD